MCLHVFCIWRYARQFGPSTQWLSILIIFVEEFQFHTLKWDFQLGRTYFSFCVCVCVLQKRSAENEKRRQQQQNHDKIHQMAVQTYTLWFMAFVNKYALKVNWKTFKERYRNTQSMRKFVHNHHDRTERTIYFYIYCNISFDVFSAECE